ncbi:MAG: hypothetical protein ACRC5M_01990, partial [Anaeroplasmataceae bacterium]
MEKLNQKNQLNVDKDFIDISKLANNAPISCVDTYGVYCEILHNNIKNESVKNIGIIAPYASGKSSLIETYKEKYKNDSERIITISLATYKKENDSKNKDEIDIEKSILQQFIYNEDKSKLKKSKISRITNKKPYRSISMLVISGLAFIYSIISLFLFKELPIPVMVILLLVSFASIVTFIIIIIRLDIIYKIKYKDIELDFQNDINVSYVNHYIDELLYFFNKTKTSIVIIEDFDRFESMDVFYKLRELNFLINNSKIVKHKVSFIYSIKDSIFKNSESKAKFFDYILSLVPIFSVSNAREVMIEQLRVLDEALIPDSDFIQIIGYFIDDFRVLKNIVNDYICHLKILNHKFESSEYNNKLFSLMVYKNLYPSDYSNIYFDKWYVGDFLKHKLDSNLNKSIDDAKNENTNPNDLENEIYEYYVHEFLKKSPEYITEDQKRLATFLIVNNLVTSDYKTLVLRTNDLLFSKSDRDFIRKVYSKENLFEYKIDNPKNIIIDLNSKLFESIHLLNFNLLNYMFIDDSEIIYDKKMKYFNMLCLN